MSASNTSPPAHILLSYLSYLSDANVQDRYAEALLLVLMENVPSFFPLILTLSGPKSDRITF